MKHNKEYLSLHFKSIGGNDEYIEIEGVATDISKDRDGDVVLPLSIDVDNYNKNPIILYQHDKTKAIGKTISLEKTETEVRIKAQIFKTLNPEVFAGVKNGILKTFSIGFIGKDGHYDEETDTWFWTKIELLEISVVTVPANTNAIFSVKTLDCGKTVCGIKTIKTQKEGINGIETITSTVISILKEKGLLKEKNESGGVNKEENNDTDNKEPQIVEDETIENGKKNEELQTTEDEVVDSEENEGEGNEVELDDSNSILNIIENSNDIDELLLAHEKLTEKINQILEGV